MIWAKGGMRGLRLMQELACSLHCRAAPALSPSLCSGAPLLCGSPMLSSLPPLLFCHLFPLCLCLLLGETRLSQASRGSCWVLPSMWGTASSSGQGGPEPSALSRSCLWGQGCCSLYEVLLHLLSSFLKISLWTAFKKHISTIKKTKIID